MKFGIDGRLWYETGVGRYIRNLVWQLQTFDKKNDYVLFVQKGFKKKDLLNNHRWKIVETDIHWHSLSEQLKFPEILNRENLDLVHFPYFSLPIFYNKPFVVTIHDLIINHFPTGKASTLPYPLYQAKRIGYDFVLNHAVTNSKKIIVPLVSVKEDVMQTLAIPEEKIVVTYEGVDRNAFRLHTPLNISSQKSPPYFLYVGNAYPHKNLEALIEGFRAFKKEIRDNVQLYLVGKDDFFYKRLHEMIIKEKLEGIVIKHHVSDEELASLYAHAKAFVSASRMEGFGLPPLEALTLSCPVVLSDIPSFREVCGESAIYFDPTSLTSLKDKLHFVYNLDHKSKEKYVKKGIERVKEFSWPKMAKETLQIYESCISV